VEQNGDTVSTDEAAEVMFYEKASEGWGRYDATKLAPFNWSYATISPLSPAGDSLKRTAQVGLPWPSSAAPIEVPLDLTAVNLSGKGVLQLADALQADGWAVKLVDTRGTSDPGDDVTRTLQREGGGYRFSLSSSKSLPATSADEKSAESGVPRSRRRKHPGALTLTERIERHPRRKTFRSTKSKSSSGSSPRFVLRFTPSSSALPVEMSQFKVQSNERAAVLQWQTASETNNAGFRVQHQALSPGDSTTEEDEWTRLGFVEGHGTTERPQRYEFTTDELKIGTHAFRLVQVDTDGSTFQSEVKRMAVRLTSAYEVGRPYPNPVQQQAKLPITVRNDQNVDIQIYDILGRQVRTVQTGAFEGQETKIVRLPTADFASGSYFVRVRGKEFVVTRRFTVVR
jgi:hypothetical protein